jgi:hypothetical protein
MNLPICSRNTRRYGSHEEKAFQGKWVVLPSVVGWFFVIKFEILESDATIILVSIKAVDTDPV